MMLTMMTMATTMTMTMMTIDPTWMADRHCNAEQAMINEQAGGGGKQNSQKLRTNSIRLFGGILSKTHTEQPSMQTAEKSLRSDQSAKNCVQKNQQETV